MKIRHKLNLNTAITAIGIIIIAGFSLSGMKYVQSKLNVLTERSTPYQLKTIALQRALQEHIANLLKVSAATTETELANLKAESGKSLNEVKQLTQEVSSFKGVSAGSEKLAELESITNEITTTINERIKAEAAGQAADRQINEKLQHITVSLQKINSGMKSSQKKFVSELSSTNDNVKRSSLKTNLTQGILNSLGDMQAALLEIAAADQKGTVEAASGKLTAAGQAITKSLFMRSEKNNPVGKEISSGLTDLLKQVTGSGGLTETKIGLLGSNDESARKKFSQEINAAVQKVARLTKTVGDYSGKMGEASKEEGKKFDLALENSVILSDNLASNSDLVEIGGEIKGVAKGMFGARTKEELDRMKQKADALFTRANTLLLGKMKNVAGSAGVVASLNEVKQTLMTKGGAAEKLENILAVNAKIAKLNDKLKAIVNEQRKEGEAGMSSARSDQENAIKAVNKVFRASIAGVLAIGAAILVVGILFSYLLGRSITRPIGQLEDLAEHFGKGDFKVKMDDSRKDEFGALAVHFNTASGRLTEIVSDLKAAIDRLGRSSQQLNTTSASLMGGAHEQAAQAVQSATALEELTRTISEVAQNAAQAANATRDASGVAVHGKETVAKAVTGMQQIAASVGAAAETIQQLGQSSEQIGNIIEVINDIADQTNLLALNAAIEAARAGESGRGFAVVADEVRKLAQRTTEATKEISSMITEIQRNTTHSVETMETGKHLVAQGVELANEASQALDSIVETSDKGASMVELIATASEQQASVAQQVSSGVERMAELSQSADADSGKVSDAATELASIAGDLDRKAAWFELHG